MAPCTSSFFGGTLVCANGQRLYSMHGGRWISLLPAAMYVVDDQGALVPLSDDTNYQSILSAGCPSIDEGSDEFLLARNALIDAEEALRAARRQLSRTLPPGVAA